jgi:DNA topoisomerase IA
MKCRRQAIGDPRLFASQVNTLAIFCWGCIVEDIGNRGETSVAEDIVKALTPEAGKFEKHDPHFESDGFVVISAVGHLVEIQAPEEFDVKRGKWSFTHLPVIPPYFALKPVERTEARLAAVVRQARRPDVTELVNACDAGREGELIFRLIVPVRRRHETVEQADAPAMAPVDDAASDPRRLQGFAHRRADA